MIERIDSAVFGPVPAFVRLTVRVRDLPPIGPEAAAAARAFLAEASAAARTADAMSDGPRLQAWRAAYTDVGLAEDTVPPFAALLAWARTPGGVPSQGAVPDIVNAVSLRLRTPTAGYDVGGIVGDLWLRPSRGCEVHHPLGGGPNGARPATVPLNELILADSADQAVARAWHGAPGAQAFPTPASRDVLVHVDHLRDGPDGALDPAAVAATVAGWLTAHLGGTAQPQVLSRERPQARWDA